MRQQPIGESKRSSVGRPRALRLELLESRLCLSGMFEQSPWANDAWPVADGYGFPAEETSPARPITIDPGVQQTPSIAVNPDDSTHLVQAYMDYSLLDTGYAGIGVAVSHDAGQTWQCGSIPLPEGFAQGAADPDVRFDGQGRVFVSFMAATFLGEKLPLLSPDTGSPWAAGFSANNGVFVARSDDGGRTWQPAVPVTAQQADGGRQVSFNLFPDLSVDTRATLPDGRPNPAVGNLYVTWSRYYPAGQFPGQPGATGGSDVMLAVSQDGGQSWQTRTRPQGGSGAAETVLQTVFNRGTDSAPGSGYMGWSRVSIGAEGDVYVADFAGGWFFVNHSSDAGQRFRVPTGNDSSGLPLGPGPQSLTAGLSALALRTFPARALAADPVRPGHVYVAEPLPVHDGLGNRTDAADIFFGRSTDYGQTWQTTIVRAGREAATVNDDSGGQDAREAPDAAPADQFLVRIDTNAQGDIGLIWYDTRRDPNSRKLDVFGAVSTDGGQTFSPNFRITDRSFDAGQGEFLDAAGKESIHLGDGIGLAMSTDAAYVAWTDTRAGNQDIYFRRVPLDPLPAPPNDRFEPNDTAAAATVIGGVATARHLSGLALPAGDDDWFQLQSLASGTLRVTVASPEAATGLHLEIRDAAGADLLARGDAVQDADGRIVAWRAETYASSGRAYTVRVAATGHSVQYSVDVQSLTADLGPLVHRVVPGSLQAGDQAYYLLESAAAGVVTARLTRGAESRGEATVELWKADHWSPSSAPGDSTHNSWVVQQGESLLVRVAGRGIGEDAFQGPFSLELVNLDQWAALARSAESRPAVLRFPGSAGSSQEAVADFNGDARADLAMAHAGDNVVSVSLGNGDGTFTVPRNFGVGAFRTPNPVGNDAHLSTYRRDLLAADFNRDGIPDLAVTNYDSADVSILLGRGDGTFEPQRRFDATAAPLSLTAGDVNGDGLLDLVVVDSRKGDVNRLAVLLGRGDGTFLPQQLRILPHPLFLPVVALADLDQDGVSEVIIGGGNAQGIDVLKGGADGTFALLGTFPGSRQATDLLVADFTGEGNLDIVATSLSDDNGVWLLPGDGTGRFSKPGYFPAGQGPLAVESVDWGSEVQGADGATTLGPPDGHPDLIVANSGVVPGVTAAVGPPEIVVLPALTDRSGRFAGFGKPQRLAAADQPLDLAIQDFNGDGTAEIAVVDRGGFFVVFTRPPSLAANDSRQSARDLGRVVHTVQPTLTITPGRRDAWFRLVVPSEAAPRAGDQVLDFSAAFQQTSAPGLSMEVLDERGERLGGGERFRVPAGQGVTLFVHVFGIHDAEGRQGTGAFTLVISTLPQLVSVEAPTLLPGGPVTSLVLAFQGDRLDPLSAEDPANYRVTWLGPDGIAGTGDERVLVVGAGSETSRAVVYNPGANVEVTTGRTYPTAVRQTVTLLFAEPLPAGSYQLELGPQIQALPFNDEESGLLAQQLGLSGHPLVSLSGGAVRNGTLLTVADLVADRGGVGGLSEFEAGTRFLTQFHDDLGSLLDRLLSAQGDHPTITAQLLDQVISRFTPGLGPPVQRPVSLLVLVLDPVSISLVDREGKAFDYDLQTNTVSNGLARTYVEVGGNVELVVLANPAGMLDLTVKDVPPLARGGWVYFGSLQDEMQLLTDQMRSGVRGFRIGSSEVTVGHLQPAQAPLSFVMSSDGARSIGVAVLAPDASFLLTAPPTASADAMSAVWQFAPARSGATSSTSRSVLTAARFASMGAVRQDVTTSLRRTSSRNAATLWESPHLLDLTLRWSSLSDVSTEQIQGHPANTGAGAPERPGRSRGQGFAPRTPRWERQFAAPQQGADAVLRVGKREPAGARRADLDKPATVLPDGVLAVVNPRLAEAADATQGQRSPNDPSAKLLQDPSSTRGDRDRKTAAEPNADADQPSRRRSD